MKAWCRPLVHEHHEEPSAAQSHTPPAQSKRRLVVAALLFVATLLLARLSGLDAWLRSEQLRHLISDSGGLGVAIFVAVFAVGTLFHVPGFVFVVLAGAVFDGPAAFLAAYVGAVVSVTVTFLTVRRVGGRGVAAGSTTRPGGLMRRALAWVDRRPVLAVVVLRSLVAVLPLLNYSLALSKIRFKDYLLGSALGLVVPIAVMTALSRGVLAFL